MRFRLIPREEKFFADFITLADRIVSGATLLERMLASDPPAWDTALQIKQIEIECDALTHNIIQRLNQTFVTPIDREDIHALAKSLDDVMDAIDAAAAVTRRYRMSQLRYGARELASLTWQSAMQVKVAVEALEQQEGRRTSSPSRSIASRTRPTTFTTKRCAGCSRKRRTPSPSSSGRKCSTCSKRPPTAARTAPTCSKASSSSTDSAGVELALVVLVIVVALVFDYINGFHDAANSIATVVSTRVLSPGKAVIWAAFFNFAAAFVFGTAVAKTVGSGHDRHQRRHLVGDPRRPDRRDRVGPDHLVLRAADQLVARADRRLCRRGGRQGRAWSRSSRRAGPRR